MNDDGFEPRPLNDAPGLVDLGPGPGPLKGEEAPARARRDLEDLVFENLLNPAWISCPLKKLDIKSASELPDPAQIKEIREPWIDGEIVVPQD